MRTYTSEYQGWVAFPREIASQRFYKNPTARSIFLHMLLLANHKDNYLKDGTLVQRGQYVYGQEELAKVLGFTRDVVRVGLNNLKKWENLTIKTTNAGSIATIVNYDYYASSQEKVPQPNPQSIPNASPADPQPVPTNNNVNNENHTNHVSQSEKRQTDCDEVERFKIELNSQLNIEDLAISYGSDMGMVHTAVDIITDVAFTEQETIRVKGETKQVAVVRSLFKKLTDEHIVHAIEQFKNQSQKVTDKTAYFRSCLYTAVMEYDAHYINLVNHNHGIITRTINPELSSQTTSQSRFSNFSCAENHDHDELDSIGFNLVGSS